MSPEEDEDDDEEVALEIITYIGLGISIIALILTIITYLFSRYPLAISSYIVSLTLSTCFKTPSYH